METGSYVCSWDLHFKGRLSKRHIRGMRDGLIERSKIRVGLDGVNAELRFPLDGVSRTKNFKEWIIFQHWDKKKFLHLWNSLSARSVELSFCVYLRQNLIYFELLKKSRIDNRQ